MQYKVKRRFTMLQDKNCSRSFFQSWQLLCLGGLLTAKKVIQCVIYHGAVNASGRDSDEKITINSFADNRRMTIHVTIFRCRPK